MQARLVSTIRSASACSSMSSQTQPQKVQVACFVTVSSIASPLVGWTVRTGRRGDEASPQGEADATPACASRHKTPGLDLFPGGGRFSVGRLGRDFLNVVVFS